MDQGLEAIELKRRPFSQMAAVLLDLSALLGLPDVYSDIRNDVLAVDLVPQVLITEDGADQFSRFGFNNRWEHNPDYAGELGANVPAAPHLGELAEHRTLAARGRAWDLLAISAALRDRHFPAAIKAMAATVCQTDP